MNLNKILDLNASLEKKTTGLAEIREIPTKAEGILKFLDDLMDIKKIYKEIVGKIETLAATSKEYH